MSNASLATIAALALVTIAPVARAASAIASGAYDNALLLAVGPSGEVSGYFDMTQPGTPSFSCIFYLKGRLAGGTAMVSTYFPDNPKGDLITGVLASSGPGKARIALPSEHGGCANLWPFANQDTPADFKLQQPEPWTAVRVVKADKAYFSPTPGAAHARAYLVKGDGVGVRRVQGAWVQADFIGEKHASSGWLRAQDLYPP